MNKYRKFKVKDQKNLKKLIAHLKKTRKPFGYNKTVCIAAHITYYLTKKDDIIISSQIIADYLGVDNKKVIKNTIYTPA